VNELEDDLEELEAEPEAAASVAGGRAGPRSRVWGEAPSYPWQPEDAPELGREETALHALEGRLADVRRLLLSAARVRSPLRREVLALAELSGDLHRQVLEGIAAGGPR
jgi:hypothetical protein